MLLSGRPRGRRRHGTAWLGLLVLACLASGLQAQIRDDGGSSRRGPREMSPAERLVYQALQLQGGAERLEKLRSFRSKVRLTVHRPDGSLDVSLEECWERPGHLYMRQVEGDLITERGWDGSRLRVRSRNEGIWSKVETFTPEEDPASHDEVQETLRRVDRLLNLMAPGATFEQRSRRLVRIRHQRTGNPFEFRDPSDQTARQRSMGREDLPSRLSILDVIEIERRDPDGEVVRLYIDDTEGSESRGFIVGIIARSPGEPAAATHEVLWCRTFMELEGQRESRNPVKLPHHIQIYQCRDLTGPQEISTEVEILELAPDVSLPSGLFRLSHDPG